MRLIVSLLVALGTAGCSCDAMAQRAAPAPLGACAPAPLAAPACANGVCAVPQAAAAPLPYGSPGTLGVEYGPPGFREHAMTAAAIPLNWTGCLATGAYKGVQLILETANCIVANTFPTPPPSQRTVIFVPAVRATAPVCAPPAAAGAPCR